MGMVSSFIRIIWVHLDGFYLIFLAKIYYYKNCLTILIKDLKWIKKSYSSLKDYLKLNFIV